MINNHRFRSISHQQLSTWASSIAISVHGAFFLCALLFAPQALSSDISGFWKHEKEPVWIEIRLEEGVGTVVRNEKFPERLGRKVLKDLRPDTSKQGSWRGLVYLERLGKYTDVEISLSGADRMLFKGQVGFMSRTTEWVRAEKYGK
jgi:uncharacterized protein (DUF2147 family)